MEFVEGIVVHSLVFLVGLASRAEAISMQGLILDDQRILAVSLLYCTLIVVGDGDLHINFYTQSHLIEQQFILMASKGIAIRAMFMDQTA